MTIEKYLDCTGEYDDVSHSYRMYQVPIYSVPLNKKEFCRPFSSLDTKEGKKDLPLCGNYYDHKTCNRCVDTAKKLYKMNH